MGLPEAAIGKSLKLLERTVPPFRWNSAFICDMMIKVLFETGEAYETVGGSDSAGEAGQGAAEAAEVRDGMGLTS